MKKKTFTKTPSVLAFAKGVVNGSRCHTTRSLRDGHVGEGAYKKI